ncbi:MAG: hypothetical protein ACJA0M_001742 [Chitinophagales bacterium]
MACVTHCLSNIFYFQELSQYFAPEAQSLTLLHTWSLAVEEQFYLIWPAILFLSFKKYKGEYSYQLFVVAWLVFFALSIYLSMYHSTAAYYLLPARIFELMLGAGVALFSARLPKLNRISADAVAFFGLMMIMATAIILSKHDVFPGYNALWPTLGAAMIIYAGLHHKNTFVGVFLASSVMVFFGRISYSLYLWHWPPVALMHYQLIEITLANTLISIVLVILISWLSYYFLERRYLNRPWSLRKSFLVLILLPLMVIWAIQATIRIADDLSFRFPVEKREIYKIISNNNAGDLYKECFKGDALVFSQSEKCLFGPPTEDGKFNSMLIGDSHAIAQIGFLEALLEDTDYYALAVTRASTPFLITEEADIVYKNNGGSFLRSKALTDYLYQSPKLTIFLGARWDAYLVNENYQTHFINSVRWLIEHGHQVIMLNDAPALPSSAYAECLLKNMDDCTISFQKVQKKLANFYNLEKRLSLLYPQVLWLNLRQAICDESRCQTVLNGIPLYRDESHLNNVGAKEIGRVYLERFGNPLKLE